MTINISNSTIASLNLGNVVGNLTASINELSAQGHADLASEIKALTEALASANVPEERRRELLDHLCFVSREVALPPGERRTSTLELVVSALQKGVTVTGGLVDLWKPIEHILKGMGVRLP